MPDRLLDVDIRTLFYRWQTGEDLAEEFVSRRRKTSPRVEPGSPDYRADQRESGSARPDEDDELETDRIKVIDAIDTIWHLFWYTSIVEELTGIDWSRQKESLRNQLKSLGVSAHEEASR